MGSVSQEGRNMAYTFKCATADFNVAFLSDGVRPIVQYHFVKHNLSSPGRKQAKQYVFDILKARRDRTSLPSNHARQTSFLSNALRVWLVLSRISVGPNICCPNFFGRGEGHW